VFDGSDDDISLNVKFFSILLVAVFFSFWGGIRKIEIWQEKLFTEGKTSQSLVAMVMVSIVLFVVCLGSITSSGFNPFIYFRF
jgi:alginate O-acetyltransferase complex protein AlgI